MPRTDTDVRDRRGRARGGRARTSVYTYRRSARSPHRHIGDRSLPRTGVKVLPMAYAHTHVACRQRFPHRRPWFIGLPLARPAVIIVPWLVHDTARRAVYNFPLCTISSRHIGSFFPRAPLIQEGRSLRCTAPRLSSSPSTLFYLNQPIPTAVRSRQSPSFSSRRPCPMWVGGANFANPI